MGIRGLTTYISNHADLFLENCELRDCYLVIDGCSLAAQLFQGIPYVNSAFGGDYDKFGRVITDFLQNLMKANIKPLIILDGGYQYAKYKTVKTRMQSRIKNIENLDPANQGYYKLNPYMVMPVFRDVVNHLKIKVIVCDFEADYQIASVARYLNCPVLSYDSDFYVYDCLYIAFDTMSLQARKNGSGNYFMACKLYRCDRFLSYFGGMDKAMLPLVSTLLGNDYVNKNVFSNFFAQLKLPAKSSTKINDQQRTISALLNWLRPFNFESAKTRILSRLEYQVRDDVDKIIEESVRGYCCAPEYVLKHFGLTESQDEHHGTYCLSDSSDRKYKKYYVPKWFIEKYRCGIFPGSFINLITKQTYFFQAQMSDMNALGTHIYSIPIVQLMLGILTAPNKTKLSIIARNYKFILTTRHETIYNIPGFDVFPSLHNLPELNNKLEIINSILPLNYELLEENVPDDWKLLIFTLAYWTNKAQNEPNFNFKHVQSIVICIIYLKVIDPLLSIIRDQNKLIKKYTPEAPNRVINETVDLDLNFLIKNISKNDAYQFAFLFISYFRVDSKLISNPKKFRVSDVHQFGIFQSVFRVIRQLNTLLDQPYETISAYQFYNGTFIYNVCANLHKRKDSMSYLKEFMSVCPSVYELFNGCMNFLKALGPENFYTRTVNPFK